MTREELTENLTIAKQDKEEMWLSLNRKLKKTEMKLSQLKTTNKTLQTQCKSLQSQIDKAADYINYYLLYNRKFEESQKQFKRLLKILERNEQ